MCVPELDGDKQPLPPLLPGAGFVAKLDEIDARAKIIGAARVLCVALALTRRLLRCAAAACIARRVALHKAAVHTVVGASFALRLSLLLVGEAVGAQVHTFGLFVRLKLVSVAAGLVKLNEDPDCSKLFAVETCAAIDQLKALADKRAAAKAMGRPEPLLEVSPQNLTRFLNEEVTTNEDDITSVLADGAAGAQAIEIWIKKKR